MQRRENDTNAKGKFRKSQETSKDKIGDGRKAVRTAHPPLPCPA